MVGWWVLVDCGQFPIPEFQREHDGVSGEAEFSKRTKTQFQKPCHVGDGWVPFLNIKGNMMGSPVRPPNFQSEQKVNFKNHGVGMDGSHS
jgi:hypothetical protein